MLCKVSFFLILLLDIIILYIVRATFSMKDLVDLAKAIRYAADEETVIA